MRRRQFGLVAGGCGRKAHERLARLGVAARGEELLGSRQFAAETAAAGGHRPERRERHLHLGGLRGVARRPVVVDRLVGLDGLRAIAGVRGRPCQAQQHIAGIGGLQGERLVVEGDRCGIVALGRAISASCSAAASARNPAGLAARSAVNVRRASSSDRVRVARARSGSRRIPRAACRPARRPDVGQRLRVFLLVDQPGRLRERPGGRHRFCAPARHPAGGTSQ